MFLRFQGIKNQIGQYKIIKKIYGEEDSDTGIWLAEYRINQSSVTIKAQTVDEYDA